MKHVKLLALAVAAVAACMSIVSAAIKAVGAAVLAIEKSWLSSRSTASAESRSTVQRVLQFTGGAVTFTTHQRGTAFTARKLAPTTEDPASPLSAPLNARLFNSKYDRQDQSVSLSTAY